MEVPPDLALLVDIPPPIDIPALAESPQLVTDFPISTFMIRLQQFRLRRRSIAQIEHIFERWLTTLTVSCSPKHPFAFCHDCGHVAMIRETFRLSRYGHFICYRCLAVKKSLITLTVSNVHRRRNLN